MGRLLRRMLGGGLALAIAFSALAEPSVEDNPQTLSLSDSPAELQIANRSIMVFRAILMGEAPAVRVERAEAAIGEILGGGGELQVSIQPIQKSFIVLLNGRRSFIVTPKDVDPLEQQSTEQTAKLAAERLRQVVAETHEGRTLSAMLSAIGYSVAATLLFVLLLWFVHWLRRKLYQALPMLMQHKARDLKVGGAQILDLRFLYTLANRLLDVLRWALGLLLSYEWLSFVLSRFPYTRPWGERLNSYLLDVLAYVLQGIVHAVPGLLIAVLIFFIARGISGFSQRLLKRLAHNSHSVDWLNDETLQPTTRLTSLGIWLFALAMAYPYLPGAGTEAFKGLSVLIGLMVSLGASSLVGQAASGLILTYTRTLRNGEYVRIGEHEGTVTEMGMFTTRIRTGLGEVLTLPNSMITGAVTKNYSRAVQGTGYIVDTVVTIGYDTPWRQVEAMLIEAARRTDGIVDQPEPLVFQTSLSDFYPEYRLVAQAIFTLPRPRALLMSALHAHIQDVFNEYGVQIMSPHYLGDPQETKVVAEENWYAAPAKRPAEPGEGQEG
ncbi:small-conductance mechanosensitive channel [Pseudomonas sp. TE3786]